MKKIITFFVLFCFFMSANHLIGQNQANMYYRGEMNSWGATTMTYRTLGTPNWIVTIQSDGDDNNSEFLFTDSNSDYNNKWGRGDVITLNSKYIAYASGANGIFNETNTKYYTFTWKDVADGVNSEGVVMETSASPVTIASVSQAGYVKNSVYYAPATAQTVNITLSAAKSAEENIYLRYSTDAWLTSNFVLATGSGTAYTATIPAQTENTTVSYYVLTTTLSSKLRSDLTDNPDLCTIHYNNNGGTNYEYVVSYPRSGQTGNWNSASTWLFGSVPASGSAVIISANDNVTLNADATIASMTIEAGATFTGSDGSSRTLTVSTGEQINNLGTFTANDGTVVFSGTGTVVGTVTFNNVTINGGVDFGASSTVNGTLTLESGSWVNTNCPAYGTSSTLKYNTGGNYLIAAEWNNTPQNVTVSNAGSDVHIDENGKTINGNLQVDSDCSLTIDAGKDLTVNGNISIAVAKDGKGAATFKLASDATGTGSLITNGTSFSGRITVERYLTGDWDWHFLSSPVSGQDFVDEFIEFTYGGGGNEGDPDVDIYRWEETETSDNRWINIKNTSGTLNPSFGSPSSDPEFGQLRGYLVAYNKGASITKTFYGVPHNSTINYTLSYTSDGGKGWNLISNPYPSAIDWESSGITKTGLADGYYYIYNENKTGGAGYEYYLNSSNKTDGVNGKIPATQAFFVEAGSSGGTLQLTNTARVHNSQAYLKSTVEDDENLLKLVLQNEEHYSSAQFRLRADGDENKDYYDASMLFSMDKTVPQIYSITSDGARVALNSLPLRDEELTVPLGIKIQDAGSYTIQSENIAGFNELYGVLLEDLTTGKVTDLRTAGSYDFTAGEGGQIENRFVLHLKSTVGVGEIISGEVVPVIFVSNSTIKVQNLEPGSYKLKVIDITGRIISVDDPDVSNLQSGIYLVEIITEKSKFTQKLYIK